MGLRFWCLILADLLVEFGFVWVRYLLLGWVDFD